jgi:uncharacterized protein (TIGR03435 family)
MLWAHAESFDVASVKRSQVQKGIDYRGRVEIAGGRLSGRNVTLQHLIAAAYHVQSSQVVAAAGGGITKWLDSDEFDVDARADAPATPQQLRAMLQSLLADRFHLVLGREERELRVNALMVDKGGPKIRPSQGSSTDGRNFHGDMRQFADLLAVQATIPASVDPASPAIASSAPIPVIDKTGLEGVYDIDIDLKPELGTDRLTQWQRALKEQLGLKLESQKVRVEVLAVKSADRMPSAN